LSREQLANGIDLSKYYSIGDFNFPVNIAFNGNQLEVSTKILDDNGDIIVEIADNEWRIINPDLSWDRNFNHFAFEIIGDVSTTSTPNIIPLLQVVMQDQNTVLIGCYAKNNRVQLIATVNKGMFTYPISEQINQSDAPRLFKYPSKDYPALLENSKYVHNITRYDPDTNSIINSTDTMQFPTNSDVKEADDKIFYGFIMEISGGSIGIIVPIFATTMWIYQQKESEKTSIDKKKKTKTRKS
jgi:hypothetical protein